MNDRDAFIAAIIADPTNDMPRLVFADWLDEHDEPERAEFIRSQFYELKRDESDHTDYVGRPLNQSYQTLRWISAGFGDWTWNGNGGDGIGVVADNGVELIYRRGFVAEVYCPLPVWMEHGSRLVREHPIESVRITDLAPTEQGDGIPYGSTVWEYSSADVHYRFPPMFGHLPEWFLKITRLVRRCRGDTREAAQAALSDALIVWAKSQTVDVVK